MNDAYPVKSNLDEMLTSLAPVLQPGTFVFCSTFLNNDAKEAMAVAKAVFVEDEGLSIILPRTEAVRLGMIFDTTWRQITLMVYSSLEGVGLTAAVATKLADHGIPANIVAATHHDHVFVPARQADEAVEALRTLQREAQARAG